MGVCLYNQGDNNAFIASVEFKLCELENQATLNKEFELTSESGEACGVIHLQIAFVRECTAEFLVTDTDFTHPLHTAAGKGYIEAIRALVARDEITVDDQDEDSRRTALHMAAMKDRLEVAQLLLE